jgi:hydrogenase maturation protein HypF
MGRLFDAVAALLGVADDATFEGSPAMMLEAVSSPLRSKPASPPRYRFGIENEVIDPEPVIRALLDDLVALDEAESELTVAELARRFHDSVVIMIGDICTKAARATGLEVVVLSGGVFMNRLLASGARDILETKGLRVVTNEALPVNDGCISYGQAIVAAATVQLDA